MKQKKLAPILAVTMSLQLIVSPVIGYAQTQQQPSTAEKFTGAMEAASQLWSTVMSMKQPQYTPQQTYDMQRLNEQQVPTTDKYFNSQNLSKIPGLGNYLALNNINPQMLDCKTLPTTLHEVRAEVCQMGITTDNNIAPQAQLQEMWGYYNSYFQISKQYKNFSAESNSGGQLFGVGCMKNAMNILNGFFKYRMDELDKLTTNLESIQNQFRESSRSDLDALEEVVAQLEGGESTITNKVKSKKPDLFDFSKRFGNAACNSMFASEKFQEFGQDKGLNNIKRNIKSTMSQQNGKYSGESYGAAHMGVVEDLTNLAKKVGQQAKLRFSTLAENEQGFNAFLRGLPGSVSSTTGANSALTADLFSDLQANFAQKSSVMNARLTTAASELRAGGADPTAALSLVKNLNANNFNAEVTALENQLQNGCLSSNLGGSLDTVLGNMVHATASSHANKNASNFLKDKLRAVIENKQTSLDKKIAELRALESSEREYFITLQNKRQVQVLDANGNVQTVERSSKYQSPSSYFIDSIQNCQAQFKMNNLNSSLPGAKAIAEIKNIKNEFTAMANTNAQEMEREVYKKLVECSSPEIAASTIVGSCTPALFNPSTPGFCAAGAKSCSDNMKSCAAEADKQVSALKTQKTDRTNNYKALLDKNKQDIVKIFDTALSQYMREGEALRGLFGAGFTSPTGIQREVPEGNRYLSAFQEVTAGSDDGKLLLEDPDKYVEMFKGNIAKLKEQVAKQQDQILGGASVGNNSGLLANHIKQTEKNYRDVTREAEQISNQCIGKYQEFVRANEQQIAQQRNEAMKKQTELGEKQAEYCQRFNMEVNHPGPGCSGNLTDIERAAFGNGRLAQHCLQSQNSSETSGSTNIVAASRLCMGVGINVSSASAGSTTATPAPGNANTDAPKDNSDLIAACNTLKTCMADRGTAGRGTGEDRVEPIPGCRDNADDKAIILDNIQRASGTESSITMNDAPYFCNAGNNSQYGNKGMFGTAMDSFNQGMQSARGAAR